MPDRGPIHTEVTVGTKGAKESLDDLTHHARNWGEGFTKAFAQEPMGERRFRGTLEGITRIMTESGSAAEKASGAFELLFSRLSLGAGVGAGLAVAGVGVAKLAQFGEELRKRYSELGKEAQQANREARLTDAAEGLEAVTQKAVKAHHEIRKFSDELRKSHRQTFVREASENLSAAFAHPVEAIKNAFGLPGAEQPGARRKRERESIDAKGLAEAQEHLAQYSRQREEALELEVGLQDKMLHGSEEEIANEKILTAARLEQMKIESLRLPNEAKLNELLRQKTSKQLELSHLEQQSRNAQLASALRLGQIEQTNLTTREKSVAAAYEGLRAAREQEEMAQTRSPQARAEARVKTQEAAKGVVSAEESTLVKEGEEEGMTTDEKYAQQRQRIKERDQLRHAFARRGIRSDLIEGPKWGEAEYDPLAKWRGMRERELAQPSEGMARAAQQGQQQTQLPTNTDLTGIHSDSSAILTFLKTQPAKPADKKSESSEAPKSTSSQPQSTASKAASAATSGAIAGTISNAIIPGSGLTIGIIEALKKWFGGEEGKKPAAAKGETPEMVQKAVQDLVKRTSPQATQPQENQGPMSLQQATKSLEQDERRSPVLTLMKGDVESIKDDIHSLATRSPGGSPGGGGGGGGAPTPGGGGGGSIPTQGAGIGPIPGGRPAGIGEDQGAVNDVEQNRQAYENYWARPDVQAGMQGQADVGAEAAAAYAKGEPPFSHSSARDPLPKDDSWMKHGMSRAPFLPGYQDYKNRPMLPIDDNTDFSKWNDIAPPAINPQAQGGNIGGQGQGMDQAGFEKIVNKMTQIWG